LLGDDNGQYGSELDFLLPSTYGSASTQLPS
jgi:hypothetical protein